MISKKLLVILILLYIFGALLHLGRMYLHREEPRRSIIAMEMNYSKNYIEPHVLGRPYFRKPPLHNIMIAIFFKLFGINEWSARMVSVLSMITIAVVIFFVSKNILGFEASLFSAFSFALAFISYFDYGILAETDMFFSMFVFLSLVSIFKRKLFLGSIFTALALLTKGLPALHFFYLTLLVYAFVKRDIKGMLFSKQTIFGGVLIFLLFFGWLALVSKGNIHRFDLALGTVFNASGKRVLSVEKLGALVKHLIEFPISFWVHFLPVSAFFLLLLKKSFYTELKESIRSDPKIRELMIFSMSAFLPNILIYWILPAGRVRYVLALFAVLSFVSGAIYYVIEYYSAVDFKRVFRWLFAAVGAIALFAIFFDFEFVRGIDYYVSISVFVLSFISYFFITKFNMESLGVIFGTVVLTVMLKLLYLSTYNAYLFTYYENYREYGQKVARIILSNHPKYVMTDGGNLRLFVYVEKYLGMQLHPVDRKHGIIIARDRNLVRDVWMKLELPDHIYYVGKR